MTPDRWRQITDVFHAVLAREAQHRASYLDQACAGDLALREEVDAMLGAHDMPADVSVTSTPRLAAGTMIGPYRVGPLIGAGGMGEVYRARDTNLGRDVALKVLPAAFTADVARLTRFEREARMLAALNHPNIAAIYGVGDNDSIRALILELVDGDTLADRLARGPIPLQQALAIARQLAEALEAAHEKGIVHRDLKPANIKVTADGMVKVLDFGLAKAWSGDAAVSTDLSALPTVTATAVRDGVVMGTPAYMSPEQAQGTAVDRRTDIWAFGCVLYEMLTGRPAFAGEDVSNTLARVLMQEPDWQALPPATSPPLRRLLRRCLAKDRRQRLSDAADARLEIAEAQTQSAEDAIAGTLPARHVMWRRTAIVWLAAVIVAVGTGRPLWLTIRPAPPAVSRLIIPLGEDETFMYGGRHLVAFSPDSRHIVYQANQGLYLRPLDQLRATFLTGTDGGGRSPFFSRDGQWIGFWAGGQLKRIGLGGGAAVTLCNADNPWGASSEANGIILFGQGPKGIWKVPESGGTPEVLIGVEPGAAAHGPQFLGGSEWVLFTLLAPGTSSWNAAQIVAQSVRTGERKVLIERGRDARYVPTGHLVYATEFALLAVPFDAGEMRVTGTPVTVIEGIGDAADFTGAAHFSMARDGSLVYAPGISRNRSAVIARRTVVWVDRQGREEPINVPPDAYLYPRLSPDGTRLAVDVTGENRDVWIWDFARQTPTRFTFDAAQDSHPVWSPDGRRLLWASQRAGPFNLYWQAADGTGPIERLTATSNEQTPYDFSHDGTVLLLRQESPGFRESLSLLTMEGDRHITPLVRTAFNVRNGEISPDGRWLAYESDESGREEIYVRPFPGIDEGRWQVSTQGGRRPVWARNVRELFYQAPDGALLGVSVSVEAGRGLRASVPTRLVEGRYFTGDAGISGRTYDVSADGQRFIMIRNAARQNSAPAHFVVVLNWHEELKRLVLRN